MCAFKLVKHLLFFPLWEVAVLSGDIGPLPSPLNPLHTTSAWSFLTYTSRFSLTAIFFSPFERSCRNKEYCLTPKECFLT